MKKLKVQIILMIFIASGLYLSNSGRVDKDCEFVTSLKVSYSFPSQRRDELPMFSLPLHSASSAVVDNDSPSSENILVMIIAFQIAGATKQSKPCPFWIHIAHVAPVSRGMGLVWLCLPFSNRVSLLLVWNLGSGGEAVWLCHETEWRNFFQGKFGIRKI